MKILFLPFFVASLLIVGCGDDADEVEPNNGSTNNGLSNNGTNNGASNNGGTNNGTSNNGTSNNGVTNNGATNNGNAEAWILCRQENDDEADGIVDQISTYLYDPTHTQLNRIETRHPAAVVLDYATTYTYQNGNVVLEEVDRGFDSIVDSHITREHDANGQRTLERSYNGMLLQYEKSWEHNGDVTVERDDSDGNGMVDYVTTITFHDRAENKLSRQELADGTGAIQYINTWQYDAQGRVTTYEFLLSEQGGVVSRTTYEYEGNVTRQLADYDLDGQVDQTTQITVDANGTIHNETRDADGVVSFTSSIETDGQDSDTSEYDYDADGVIDTRYVLFYRQDSCD